MIFNSWHQTFIRNMSKISNPATMLSTCLDTLEVLVLYNFNRTKLRYWRLNDVVKFTLVILFLLILPLRCSYCTVLYCIVHYVYIIQTFNYCFLN
jgi:hypothetical protein